MKENKYFVYVYKRKDNGNVFYIGKGCNHRDKDIYYHNQYCINICEKYGVDIERIKDGLSEAEALNLERTLIKYYVDELGYSIALDGLRNRESEKFLCNHTLGGEGISGYCGMSQEEREKRRKKMSGENNIAKRPEVREKISKHAKENNSFKLPHVRKKLSENHKMKNPEEVKRQSQKMKEFYQSENGKILKEKISRSRIGKTSANAQTVKCIERNKEYVSITQCAKDLGIDRRTLSKKLEKNNIVGIAVGDQILHITKIPSK